MDDINENVNDPTEMTSEYIITDVLVNTAFSVVGTDLAFYSSCYIEHNVGIYGQMYSAEIRSGEPTNSSTYDNAWTAAYNDLYNLKVIREKCSEGGSEEGNYHTLGIAQIMTAYDLAIVTDMFGNVPWTEALQPGVIYTPVLDEQEAIYDEIFTFLDNGITNLEKETDFSSLGDQDVYYGGDESLWIKFAYGLKARYTMRLSYRDAQYDKVIEYADKSFTSADEQCEMNYNGTSTSSPFYQFFTDRDYFGTSQSFHDKLDVRNDPRDEVMFEAYSGTSELIYAPNGSPKQVQGYYGVSTLSVVDAPTYLLSYHEIEFLKAEAYARSNDLTSATAELKKAVIAACAKVNIGIDETTSETYFNDEVSSRLTSIDAALNEIMVQKYIAFYEEEAVEAYNDIRRLKAMGDNPIDLDNTLDFPLRCTYGNSDVSTNVNVADAYGDGSYVYTENVWWAGGSR